MLWNAEIRRILSRERGAVFKDWGGRIPIALIYPNSYYVGMSNLGFQTIYALLNGYNNIVCERVFRGAEGGKKGPEKARALPPVSLESQRPLSDFAALAFSISYELDYFNVVRVLKASGVPLHACDRGEGDPLVVAGGPCITANPEPLAPFFDCFAIGEGEAILPSLVQVLSEGLLGDREGLFEELRRIPGVYVPARNSRQNGTIVRRQWARNLDDFATASAVITPDTELGDMYLLEATRGCGRGCRFCLGGYLFRPFRARSLETLLAQAEIGMNFGQRLGLVGAAVSDHPRIEELVAELRKMGASLSLSSLRMDSIPDNVLEALAESGTRTVTMAPEAGSEQLRQVISKGITDDDVLRAVDRIACHGLRQLKLYFVIGLPTETDEDFEDLMQLVLAGKKIIERRQAATRLTIALTPFVPKAGTPFQWLPMARPDVLNHRISVIKSGLRREGVEVKAGSVGWSLVQGVLARGDSKFAEALFRMSGNSLADWHRALRDCHLDPGLYAHRELPLSETLPWAALDSGVDQGYLKLELRKAEQGSATPPCPLSECHWCGVC